MQLQFLMHSRHASLQCCWNRKWRRSNCTSANIATAHAVELNGAKAVFVDANLNTGNIDIEKIEKKLQKKQKLYGCHLISC